MKNLFKVTFAVAAITFATSCSSPKADETAAPADTAAATMEAAPVDTAAAATTDTAATAAAPAEGEAHGEEHK